MYKPAHIGNHHCRSSAVDLKLPGSTHGDAMMRTPVFLPSQDMV